MKKSKLTILIFTVVAMTFSSGCGSPKAAAALSPASSFMTALAGNPNLSTLTGLLKSPEIGKLLGGLVKKPFTLLAPTNDAFSGLGADALSNLMKPENIGQVATLLQGHIVPGKLDAATIMKGGLKSASGSPLNLAGANLGTLIGSDQANIIPIDKILK